MNPCESCSISFDITEILTTGTKTAVGKENVSEFSILLSATMAFVCRYTGCNKIKLNVRTVDSSATIEIDLASMATIGYLFKQSQLKLEEAIKGSLISGQSMEIELSGDVMRPVIRSMKESADSEASILFQYESAENKAIYKFVYSGKHYSDELIRQMARHFINILSDIIERPDVQVKNIRMFDPEEEKNIIERGTGPTLEIARKCAHEFFEEQAAKNPAATALICGNQRMSFGELNSRANEIGHYLQSLGVVPETIIGIGMERSIEAVVCILAIFKAGGAYTIVDAEYPAARIREILSDARISLLITKSSLKAGFNYEDLRIIDYDQFAAVPKENSANVVSNVTVDNTAYITFTSGSTGKPKGIIGIHYGITTMLDSSKSYYEKSAANKAHCLLSPLSFGASVSAIFLPLRNGIPLVIIPEGEEKDPYKFACYIGEHNITNFIATPALVWQLCSLNDEVRKMLQSVIRVSIGGSEVTSDLVRAVKRVMPNVTISVGYTSSEIGAAVFSGIIEEADLKKEEELVPLGHRLWPNTQAYILDADMNIVPVGVPGELYVAAPYISRGYIGRPDLTKERFISNPFANSTDFTRMYRTGDILRYRFDGKVEYIGRTDSEVKIRGFRVETEEIESVLRNHEAVEDAVVTPDKGKYSERLVAWVVRKPEAEADISELRRHIKKYLPAYMVPSVFIFMKQFPLNANGKIDHMALSFDATEYATSDYERPRNQLESTVTDIWEKILGREKIGIHDDFLDLGGDSIQAGLISLKIRDCFNVEIPIIMFFEDATVAKLAEEIYCIQENND